MFLNKVKWSELTKWWVIDYKENLLLRLASWFKINTSDIERASLKDPYMRGMFYTIDLADRLIKRGFRVIYANFSWVEFRNDAHGGWPDLLIGKNGNIGLVEVKGRMNTEEAIKRIIGKEVTLRTNFFKGANYVKLAEDLGANLFLAYFDTQVNDYRLIPILVKKGIEGLTIFNLVEELRRVSKNEKLRVVKEKLSTIKVLTLDDLDYLFK